MSNQEFPPVSCYCSTFGRPHALEQAIESFLKQDYQGKKELVVFNDFPKQILRFEHPEVRIINSPYRLKPLGYKFNTNISLCKHDILVCWEDDDIYLPNRLSFIVPHIQKRHIFHTSNAYYEVEPFHIIKSKNIFHATHGFTRKAYLACGQYPELDRCTVDTGIIGRFQNLFKANYTTEIDPKDYHYIYRWGTVNSYHGSGWGAECTEISDLAGEIVDNQVDEGLVPTGEIQLNPHWSYNYLDFLPKEKTLEPIPLSVEHDFNREEKI